MSWLCICGERHTDPLPVARTDPHHPKLEMNLEDPFDKILAEMYELHGRKGADYGTNTDPYANVRASSGFDIQPWIGALVRANDKMFRLQSFVKNGSLANEGVEDSLLDLATYAIIALVLFREKSKIL